MTQDSLESRRESLTELEKSEREARRLEEALGRGRVQSRPTSEGRASNEGRAQAESHPEERDENGADIQAPEAPEGDPGSAYLPPHPGPNPVRRRAPGMGLLSALSYTLHGMMDADPETARRSGISKTRETISQVRGHLPRRRKTSRIDSLLFAVSWKMHCIYRLRTSSMRVRQSKQTWIASSGRRSPTSGRWPLTWHGATVTGARRYSSLR